MAEMRFRSADRLDPVHIGRRVTVRRSLGLGGATDVVGILEDADAASVAVRDREGERHVILRSDIVAARVVDPPKPDRWSRPTP